MASSIKGIAKKQHMVDASGLHVVVIHTEWNEKVVGPLVSGCVDELKSKRCQNVDIVVVPGAFELPFACKRLIEQDPSIDAVVAIGCLIKGDTMHFEYICESVSHGLMRVGLDTGIPVIFGVLTCNTEDQALMRAGVIPGHHNHGPEWGSAAITMAQLGKGKN